MNHTFDERYWQGHWRQRQTGESQESNEANPYLIREVGDLTPGTALDAGCGEGAVAIWLASHGWEVTAADISSDALQRAAAQADEQGIQTVRWVRADLTAWEPGATFDLVTTHYAHPSTSQLDFYERISQWVAAGGNLLIVGHLHTHGNAQHEQHPPAAASVTAADITARLGAAQWAVVSAGEHTRELIRPGRENVVLHDVVVRVARR